MTQLQVWWRSGGAILMCGITFLYAGNHPTETWVIPGILPSLILYFYMGGGNNPHPWSMAAKSFLGGSLITQLVLASIPVIVASFALIGTVVIWLNQLTF